MWDSASVVRISREVLAAKSTVSVISLLVGAGSTYLVTKNVLKKKYEERSDREIDEARRFYKQGDYSDPIKALAKLKEQGQAANQAEDMVKDLGYTNEFTPAPYVQAPVETEEELIEDVEEKEEPRVVVQNIFVNDKPLDDNFDYEKEIALRDESYPYVISEEEFLQGEKDYSQNKMTYFEADDILIDEDDSMIPDSDPIVGDTNLSRFGHGSNDKNVVYIRNEKLEIDIEVVRDEGSYVKGVLGFDQNAVEHADRRRPRRMRSADE